MQVNRFVSVKDDNLIFGVGQYIVGKGIPAGEYYLGENTSGLLLFHRVSAVIQNLQMMLMLQSRMEIP